MLKIAMLSKWHVHARDYARQVREFGHEIALVWDDNVLRGEEWAKELGVPYFNDLDKALAFDGLDAVICDTETSKHHEVLIKAANAKKHIFTEKTLAPTLKEALEIEAAVEKSNVVFTISFPQRTSPTVQYAKNLIDSGTLGKVNTVRLRNAHGGASGNWLPAYWYIEKDACGGAMMDLGCHPMYIASYLLGKPAKITSMYNELTGKGIEDNAVNLIEFENKAIAIVETSFVTPISPWMFEIYGTEGTLQASDHNVRLMTNETKKMTDKYIEINKLPKALPAPMKTWLDAIENKAPVVFGMKDAIALVELLENAYISYKTNKIVKIK